MNGNPDASFNREREIFLAALDKASAAEREAFLDAACGRKGPLRRRLEALLGHLVDETFLEEPAMQTGSLVEPEAPDGQMIGTVIGRYKLVEKIGEGGWGIVYVADQEEPVRRRLALKIIKLGMDTNQVVARFEAERQALAMMDHPNIAKVLDAGATESGRPYFVMELVRGIHITEYCDQHGLSTQERLKLFTQVCRAVQHAHQKGIIHRDLKPSNIVVTLHEGGQLPKVIDFGIAKATEGRLEGATVHTQLHEFIGTPAYMSPEQMEMGGHDIDTRSDIYSLGVLLYELLVGNTPFDTRELMSAGLDAMRKIIRDTEPVRPSTKLATLRQEELIVAAQHRSVDSSRLRSQVRGDLDWIVMKCLEKDRSRRYDTANGLAMDIERHLANQPVVARPPSQWYLFQKLIRRNRVACSVSASVAAALLLGLGLTSWEYHEKSRAYERAVLAESRETQLREAAQAAQASEAQQRLRAEAGEHSAQRLLYGAALNLAQQAWERGNLWRLKQLLQETAASPEREFEWYYWERQTHLELTTFRGHNASVGAATFSPDGRHVVSSGSDSVAKVWDAASGEELLTLKGHTALILRVAFSPDGRRIVTASWDKTAGVWDAASGEQLLSLQGHAGWVWAAAFSPDNQRIVTGSADHTAKVWSATTGKTLLTLEGHSDAIKSVAFSRDGQRILTGSDDGTIRVWDAFDGNSLLTLKAEANLAAFSPDGQRIASGANDGTVGVWDAASGKLLLTRKGHRAGITDVAFSPDGQRIATSSGDRTAKVWDAASGKELLNFKGHLAGVNSAAFSPDGLRLATASADQTAKVWDATGEGEPLTLQGGDNPIRSVAFSPDSRRLVTGNWDQSAVIWDLASGGKSAKLVGHHGPIRSVAFSPDGGRIATGSDDHTARVWEAATGKELFTLNGHKSRVLAVAFSPRGWLIATASYDRTARVWAADGTRNPVLLKGHSASINALAFSADGRRIVTGSDDASARVWEVATGKELLAVKGRGFRIRAVAFSPDGLRIATGGGGPTASVWDSATGAEVLTLEGHEGEIVCLNFSADGRRIVSGSVDQTARVWDAWSGKELIALKGHEREIASAAFSPDGRAIATGSADGTAKVWRSATEQQVAGWQTAEQLAAERWAAVQHEQAEEDRHERVLRARDPGAIRQWLVLEPIPFDSKTGAEALDQQQIEAEAALRPRADERVKVGGRELVWTAVQLQDYLVDFNDLIGQVTERCVAYAVCFITAETDLHGLLMKVGSDDESKVYLNGQEIYRCAEARVCQPDQDVVTGVELRAGVNVLVFKVVNEASEWEGTIRFTDPTGQPVKGISVRLTPP